MTRCGTPIHSVYANAAQHLSCAINSRLPYTGADLLALALGALGVVLLGIVIRRLGGTPSKFC